jgi:hypothetical protein
MMNHNIIQEFQNTICQTTKLYYQIYKIYIQINMHANIGMKVDKHDGFQYFNMSMSHQDMDS